MSYIMRGYYKLNLSGQLNNRLDLHVCTDHLQAPSLPHKVQGFDSVRFAQLQGISHKKPTQCLAEFAITQVVL